MGDLLIALESVGIPNFFTLNRADNTKLCQALVQTLIVQPLDHKCDDEIYPPLPQVESSEVGEGNPSN